MKNNKGFIATSLIYSFFLVFIAILAALMNNYIANKTILDRFNEDAQKSLNQGSYSITFKSSAVSISNGKLLRNLIDNSDFSEEFNYWENPTDKPATKYGNGIRKNTGSKLYMKRELTGAGHLYYFTLSAAPSGRNIVNGISYIEKDSSKFGRIEFNGTSTDYQKKSEIFSLYTTSQYNIVIGYNAAYNYLEYYKDLVLIDLSDNFDGQIPTKEWLDQNLPYFNGILNFIKIENIRYEDAKEIRIKPYNTSITSGSLRCLNNSGNIVNPQYTITRDSGDYYTIKIKNINDNMDCTINWG